MFKDRVTLPVLLIASSITMRRASVLASQPKTKSGNACLQDRMPPMILKAEAVHASSFGDCPEKFLDVRSR